LEKQMLWLIRLVATAIYVYQDEKCTSFRSRQGLVRPALVTANIIIHIIMGEREYRLRQHCGLDIRKKKKRGKI
jgi:hypothetical protein